MAKLILKSSLLIKKAGLEDAALIKDILTHDNPTYLEALKHGRFISASTPRHIKLYKEINNRLIVPKGFMQTACSIVGVKTKSVVDRTVFPKIKIKFVGKLRPYQQKAANDILRNRYCILEAATGAGKTVTGCYLATFLKTRTLIIVHSKELQDQWTEALLKFTSLSKDEIGFIGGGHTFAIKKVTVGIINSVSSNIEELSKKFGLVLLDECHRCVAPTWMKTINSLRCRYQYGLSATPYKNSKLTEALFQIVGPIKHVVSKKHLEKTGAILVPAIIRVTTKETVDPRKDYQSIIKSITKSRIRNKFIAKIVYNDFIRYKEPIMVVSDRISHCETLYEYCDEYRELKPMILTSRIPKAQRKQAVEDFKKGKYNILISTVSLLGEGFDAPALNALVLTTPIRFSGRLVQICGRILRPSNSGKPRIYDFRDNSIKSLRYSGFARDKVYKGNGWT